MGTLMFPIVNLVNGSYTTPVPVAIMPSVMAVAITKTVAAIEPIVVETAIVIAAVVVIAVVSAVSAWVVSTGGRTIADAAGQRGKSSQKSC